MKKLLFIYLLLALLVQVRPLKVFFSRLLLSTVYIPILSGYSKAQSMISAEKENELLKKKLSQQVIKKGDIKAMCQDTALLDSLKVVNIVGYEPFGFPGIITYFPPYGKRGDLLLWNGVIAGRVISTEHGVGQAATLYGNLFRIGVSINGYSGMLEGGNPPIVKYIPVEYTVKKGDTVYTSGIGDSNIRGIPVGIVKKVTEDKIFPYFHRIEIRPFFEVHRAYKLTLVKNE